VCTVLLEHFYLHLHDIPNRAGQSCTDDNRIHYYSFSIVRRNNKGNSPRHEVALCDDETKEQRLWALHAVGAERCPPDTVGCTEGCRSGGTFDGIAPASPTMTLPSQVGREMLNNLVNAATEASQGKFILDNLYSI
jgi:hypothetical protein